MASMNDYLNKKYTLEMPNNTNHEAYLSNTVFS